MHVDKISIPLKHNVRSALYRNAIMFCVNFTFANFASADGIEIKNLWGWLLVGVVNGLVDIEPMNVSWLFQEER